MKPRAYALTLIVAAFALFLSVVAANVIIDPQYVFGTNLLPRSPNINHHYQRVRAYQAAADKYDGLLFGSSRAEIFPQTELSRRMGGVSFASFWVAGGMLPDHLPALEYVLRDKAKRGERLKAVFLLLDIDNFGNAATTNQFIETLLPVELSGEDPLRFWWRNLTSLQIDKWRRIIREARLGLRPPGSTEPPPEHRFGDALARSADSLSALMARNLGNARLEEPQAAAMHPRSFAQRSHFAEQLRLLERMAVLCREHGIRLVVAVTPLHRAIERLYDPKDLSHALDEVARVTPIWDFTGAEWLSDDPKNWQGDTSHFSPRVADMMLARIFGDPMPKGWDGFGRLRGG